MNDTQIVVCVQILSTLGCGATSFAGCFAHVAGGTCGFSTSQLYFPAGLVAGALGCGLEGRSLVGHVDSQLLFKWLDMVRSNSGFRRISNPSTAFYGYTLTKLFHGKIVWVSTASL